MNAYSLFTAMQILPREHGKLISNASLIRNRSDYEDFYICSIEDTNTLFAGAESFYSVVSEYLKARYENNSDLLP